ncbi:MAG: hypothetical protein COT89_00255 [Candidatus Colwellbacteria bacterium CG10_big_fil_rev_8_21_14_0_10_42_22]|uniref:Uncharacterized protein n=1 Tax=Candidatus Colwellbacteria bacterium CG10_big_fil_rev_8_21_14_0_10_42_22 TaxID=1974540 RepID=A0A2H0VGA3_9BACT|nr:MAG: hypothetical protein COT89_00255 [Candidatus Colwellbacteria bacterium CG10_big_fil_rev_8_21_14_0_10_42_22]
MTFWDFTIHVIDKRDRKYRLNEQMEKMWFHKMKVSKSPFSYYYPFFWGKTKPVDDRNGWKRYDLFWIFYWGMATILLLTYIFLS